MISELLNVDLLKELGLDTLPQDQREAIIERLTTVVESRLNRKLLSLLSDEQKKELDQVLMKDGDLLAFFTEAVPNINLITAEVIADFKKEMLDLGVAIKQEIATQQAGAKA